MTARCGSSTKLDVGGGCQNLAIRDSCWSMSLVIIVVEVGRSLSSESLETLEGKRKKERKMKFLDKCAN